LDAVKIEIANSKFTGDGYKKIHRRIRKTIKVGRNRLYRIMKENSLLVASRPTPTKKAIHDRNIKTSKPNQMWATDGKKFYVQECGWCWFFGVIDHFNDEIISCAAKKGDRFAAMEAVRNAVKTVFGSNEKDVCQEVGLVLRSDHGSQYDSNDFQNEMRFLGLKLSPAYVRSPECNGIIERFHRTLQEQVFDIYSFNTIKEAKEKIDEFIESYNREWLIHRLGLRSPLEYKKLA
jgi:transposase InsO family protein